MKIINIKDNAIKTEKNKNDSTLLLFSTIFELLYSACAVAWFFVPQFLIDNTLVEPLYLPFRNFINISYDINIFNFIIKLNISFLLYLIPLISLFKFISLFLRKKLEFLCLPDRFLSILLNILSSSLILSTYIYYLLANANNMRFFYIQDKMLYILCGAAVFFNLIFVYLILKSLIKMDKSYKDFILFKKFDKLDKKHIKFFLSIQKKLIISILITIIIIISVLSYFVLNDYKKTIINSVEDIGKTLAYQSSIYFKENYNDNININTYLSNEKQKNLNYKLKFESFSFYKKQGKEEIYKVENSTNENEINKTLNVIEIQQYSKILLSDRINDNINKIYIFVAPIRLKDKIIGFSQLKYREDVIYESYFKAQIRVILFTLLFIYISFVLIYIIGNRIVFPLLFLRMNVKKISNNLSKMINGEEKVSADLLNFYDEVKTNDEIKALSSEISNMTTVIKGMIPYVSASTFKQAHKDKDESKTVIKNLTFLFTDIRGFTTMCEGLPPKEIVELINHYLEVQTEIILKNQGDIDKFVGDEIMAVFDGPNKEINACNASMELRDMMQKDKEIREKKNLTTVSIGIGINSGPVVYGSIGAKERMDFTSIGDTVNLAARLESANKEYATKTLTTEFVFNKIKDKFLCREIDLLTVKGKTEPVRIYEILQKNETASKKLQEMKAIFEKGLTAYRRQNWDDAYEYFHKSFIGFKDETSKVFMDRIKLYKRNPPPDKWNGVFTLLVK